LNPARIYTNSYNFFRKFELIVNAITLVIVFQAEDMAAIDYVEIEEETPEKLKV